MGGSNRGNDIERATATPHPHRIEIYKIERSYHIYIYIYGAGEGWWCIIPDITNSQGVIIPMNIWAHLVTGGFHDVGLR